MLLALALLALLSAVLINGMSGFFQSKEARPDDNFWQAVTSARMQALEHEQIVSLQFNQEEKQLVWSSPCRPRNCIFLRPKNLPPSCSAGCG
jgi:Tfp pilus assembly protein FimT